MYVYMQIQSKLLEERKENKWREREKENPMKKLVLVVIILIYNITIHTRKGNLQEFPVKILYQIWCRL
jgi:hypothetical protein